MSDTNLPPAGSAGHGGPDSPGRASDGSLAVAPLGADDASSERDRRPLTRSLPLRRLWGDRLATGGMWLAVLLALIPLVFVVGYIAKQGLAYMSWAMLTEPIPTSRHIGPGIGPAVVGTIVVTVMATLMAVPLGILAAVYLNEYGRGGRWRHSSASWPT